MAASRVDAAVAPSRHLIPLFQDDLQHSLTQNQTGRTIIPSSLLTLLPTDAGTTLILAFTLSFYLATFTGVQVMRNRKGFDLRETLKAHYLIGFVTNVATLGFFITELVPRIRGEGFFDTMCSREVGWAPEMTRLYHVFFALKFYELVDIAFKVLRKRDRRLSRTTYHHGIVIVLCYCQIMGRTPMSWLLMTMNMCVHICEYWTYFQQRRAKQSVLKSWLVTLRVTEFTIGSSMIMFAFYNRFAFRHAPSLPHVGDCEGDIEAGYLAFPVILSFLAIHVISDCI